MGQTNPDPVFDARVIELQRILGELSEKIFVMKFYTNYWIRFVEIDPPELTDLECLFNDLDEDIRSFLSKALNRGPQELFPVSLPPIRSALFLQYDDARNVFEKNKTDSFTEKELINSFTDPILRFLLTFESSVYGLTQKGRSKYIDMLELIWCCGMIAISSKDRWFLLIVDWTD